MYIFNQEISIWFWWKLYINGTPEFGVGVYFEYGEMRDFLPYYTPMICYFDYTMEINGETEHIDQ